MKPTDISLVNLFQEGCDSLRDIHNEGEAKKAGNLRAGAGGALMPDGSIVGGCHRKAFARWLGKKDGAISPITQSHFDTGYLNEDNWKEKLELSWEGPILYEDEIPIKWYTSQGIRVSGRPDMVLCEDVLRPETKGKKKEIYDTKPVLVIEHKAVVSMSKAAARFLGEVDPAHLIQACHYSMELDCPATLIYTFAGLGMLPWFVKKEDREKFWPKGKGWEIKPFKKEFKIGYDPTDKTYYYMDGAEVVKTDLTKSAIRDYYELMVDMRDEKSLYKRHSSKDLHGTPLRYNVCDYCELKDTCDTYEDNYERWVDEVLKK